MQVQGEVHSRRSPLVAAGIVLGLGLGGFVDGIVFHELLQWHHMLSSVRPATTVADIELNMVWDGLFEASNWLLTVVGLALLWRAGQLTDVTWSLKTFLGALFAGAGLFNFFEGLIDHQILGIHHLKPGANQLFWDVGFLASGIILICLGWILMRLKQQESTSP